MTLFLKVPLAFCTIIVKIIYNIFVLKICRSLIINENLEVGTQIAYIKKALELNYSVVVLNTNNNYEREGMQFFICFALGLIFRTLAKS